jgi:cell division protein FtsA
MARGKIIAGIDVGTDKVCTIIASQHEETGKLNVIGVAATPSKGLKKSQVIDIDEAISAITDSVEASERMAGYNISQAWVSISGSHISAQNSKGVVAVAEPEGEINHTDVARVIEAAKAIALPSQIEIIHVIPRDYSVDAQIGIKDPVGMTGVRLEAEAHLITGASTWLKNIEKCITELGISVNGLVYSGLSFIRECSHRNRTRAWRHFSRYWRRYHCHLGLCRRRPGTFIRYPHWGQKYHQRFGHRHAHQSLRRRKN